MTYTMHWCDSNGQHAVRSRVISWWLPRQRLMSQWFHRLAEHDLTRKMEGWTWSALGRQLGPFHAWTKDVAHRALILSRPTPEPLAEDQTSNHSKQNHDAVAPPNAQLRIKPPLHTSWNLQERLAAQQSAPSTLCWFMLALILSCRLQDQPLTIVIHCQIHEWLPRPSAHCTMFDTQRLAHPWAPQEVDSSHLRSYGVRPVWLLAHKGIHATDWHQRRHFEQWAISTARFQDAPACLVKFVLLIFDYEAQLVFSVPPTLCCSTMQSSYVAVSGKLWSTSLGQRQSSFPLILLTCRSAIMIMPIWPLIIIGIQLHTRLWVSLS